MKSPVRSRSVGIFVLGMHRSGTSLLTRVLNLLGCALPGNLLGAHESNPTGHWESLDAIEINDTLLAALGRRWDDVRELPVDWLDRPETELARQRIRVLLEREFSARPLWVLKEPRLCRLAPIWLEAAVALGMETRVIVPVRHPGEVGYSLARRNGMDSGRSHLMWFQHLVEAERGSRGAQRSLLHFHALVADWKSETARIGEELGIEWPIGQSEAEVKVDRFLDPDLRHAEVLAEEPAGNDAVLPVVIDQLYQGLIRAPTEQAWRLISGSEAAIDACRSLYAPAIAGLALAVERSERHAAAVDAVLSSTLVDRPNLVLDADEVRLLREQSYDILGKIEQNGPLVVELVRQIEAQRSEFAQFARGLMDQQLNLTEIFDSRLEQATELQRQAAEKNQELAALLSALDAELGTKISETEGYESAVSLLETTVSELDLARALLTERHAQDKETISSLQREAELLKDAIAISHSALDRYDRDLKQAKSAVDDAQAQLAAALASSEVLFEKAQASERAAAILDAELSEQRRLVAQFENSTSWRLTAPLRSLMRVLRRVIG